MTFHTTTHADTKYRVIQAEGVQNSEGLSKHIGAYRDPTGELSLDALLQEDKYEFTPLSTPSPNFGFTSDKIWLHMRVFNKTTDVNRWYIHVHENFLQYYDVYLRRSNGDIEHLDSHRPTTPFSDRKVAFAELATPLTIAPKETVTLYIAYASGGSTNISLSLETHQSFMKRSMNHTSKNFISYGMMLILIVTSFLALVILRLNVFLSYLIYVIATLMFLMHSDGVTFQYLWPHAPIFNSYFSIVTGLVLAIVPYNFARVFLRTRKFHPRIDKFMVMMMIITPIFILPMAVIYPQYTKLTLMILVFFSILFGTFAGIIASIKRFREVRFYVLAWVLGAASVGVMNLRHFTNVDISQHIELDGIRLGIVVDAIMMGLGVADRYIHNLKAHREADRKNLQQARLNLNLNDRLHGLEEQYRLATELVQSQDDHLKNTVHDLRQPLHSLRLNVEKLRSRQGFDDGAQSDLDTTFTYLETLIEDHLQYTVAGHDNISGVDIADNSALDLSAILTSIYEMFLPDALDKGLEFRFVDTSQSCDVAPLVLMRIVTNLVSNAIKYTPTGKVLMGVHRTPKSVRIEVHDTGTGLTQEQFSAVQKRGVRLSEDSDGIDGRGLGLNIARTLANEKGLKLSLRAGRTSGTSIVLEIPNLLSKI